MKMRKKSILPFKYAFWGEKSLNTYNQVYVYEKKNYHDSTKAELLREGIIFLIHLFARAIL